MKKIRFFSLLTILGIVTGCTKLPDLGDGYKLDSNGEFSLKIVNFENIVMIRTHILEYAFDSTFIVVSQRPIDSVPGIETMRFNDYWKSFENSTFRQYWIINKKEQNIYSYDEKNKIATYSNIYGPYSKEVYLKKRDELNIPKELKLKE